MSNYPRFLYHRTKPAFICPSEEFKNSLDDGDEYSFVQFEKEVEETTCKHCKVHKKSIEILEAKLADSEMEVKRVRAALDIAKREVKSTKALKNPVGA